MWLWNNSVNLFEKACPTSRITVCLNPDTHAGSCPPKGNDGVIPKDRLRGGYDYLVAAIPIMPACLADGMPTAAAGSACEIIS